MVNRPLTGLQQITAVKKKVYFEKHRKMCFPLLFAASHWLPSSILEIVAVNGDGSLPEDFTAGRSSWMGVRFQLHTDAVCSCLLLLLLFGASAQKKTTFSFSQMSVNEYFMSGQTWLGVVRRRCDMENDCEVTTPLLSVCSFVEHVK